MDRPIRLTSRLQKCLLSYSIGPIYNIVIIQSYNIVVVVVNKLVILLTIYLKKIFN